jgi:hypothetical protein
MDLRSPFESPSVSRCLHQRVQTRWHSVDAVVCSDDERKSTQNSACACVCVCVWRGGGVKHGTAGGCGCVGIVYAICASALARTLKGSCSARRQTR